MSHTAFWPTIEASLKQSIKLLPPELCTQAQECLDNNEFLLAWEEMETVADDISLESVDFWRQMAKTAVLMISR
jgi:hypothetical protein